MDIFSRVWIANRLPLVSGALLEVGSFNYPGQDDVALRPVVSGLVTSYLGVDMYPGPGVDQVINENAAVWPFSANSFDTIVSVTLLENIKNPTAHMREMFRILRPSGTLFLSSFFAAPIHDFPNDYWRFTPSCLKMLVEGAGLVVFGDLTPSQSIKLGPHIPHIMANPATVRLIAKKP